MNAQAYDTQRLVYPVFGQTPEVLAQIVEEDVNIAIWQRQLPAHIVNFSAALLASAMCRATKILLLISLG